MNLREFDTVVQEVSYSIAEERMLAIHEDPHQHWSSRSCAVELDLPPENFMLDVISDGC